MKPQHFCEIVNRKRYDTNTATLLSGNDYWDGNNFERSGRNTFLYRTPKGTYFMTHLTCWQGEDNSLEVVSQEDAIEFFEHCREDCRRVSYAEAFPDVTIEDA
jgi:hypothetical protein